MSTRCRKFAWEMMVREATRGRVLLEFTVGLPHRCQGGLDIGEVVAADDPGPHGIMELGIGAVDGKLQEKHGRLDQPLGRRGNAGAVGGDGGGQLQGAGRLDQLEGALVEHGFAAPEVDQGMVAMLY